MTLFVTCNKAKLQEHEVPGDKPVREAPGKSIDSNRTRYSLYLTFDDGPDAGSTAVSEMAMSDSINVNVFLIGHRVFESEENARRFDLYQNNPFVEIGNHSFSHANNHHYHLYYSNPSLVFHDFLGNKDTLALSRMIARLPGRNCWRINGRKRDDLEDCSAAADSLSHYGYKVFGWDVEWHYDAAGKVVEDANNMFNIVTRLAEKNKSFTAGNIVILCHDPMLEDSSNRIILHEFLQKIKSNGNYRFEHLSNYPK